MADYSTTVNFAIKDGLASGNPSKVVKGTEFQLEFDNIATAVATKANLLNPSFSGTISAPTISTNTFNLNGVPVTVTAAEINKLAGLTASTAELNVLDGVTASTAELNVLDGSLATTADLNRLNATTASAIELSYCDGVTSNIQTQLNSKIGTAGDITFGGDITVTDNNKLLIGTGADLAIYHDGSDSYIEDQGIGSMWVRSNGTGFGVQNSSGIVFAEFTESNGVCSFYKIENGVAEERIKTTTEGVEVFGKIKIGGWFVEENISNELVFSIAGGDRMKLDTNGNLTVIGDVTAFGTI